MWSSATRNGHELITRVARSEVALDSDGGPPHLLVVNHIVCRFITTECSLWVSERGKAELGWGSRCLLAVIWGVNEKWEGIFCPPLTLCVSQVC